MIREDRDKRILEAVRCFMRGEKADWAAQETCDESAVAPKDAQAASGKSGETLLISA